MTSVAPIVWSKVRWCLPDPADLEAASLEDYPFFREPQSKYKIVTYISEPALLVAYEDWYKGHDIEWVMFNETLMIVQSGRAEMTYWNPPNWTERGTVEAQPGMVLFLPRGVHVWFKVTSEEPFRRVVVDIPNPGFEFTSASGDEGQ
jgi:hypothetical protein